MINERIISFIGLLVLIFLAWLLSENKRTFNWRLVLTGVGLQLIFAISILWTIPGRTVFEGTRIFISKILEFSNTGAAFVFGNNFKEHFFAFSVLPTIIFVSSLMSVLFYLGIMQLVVAVMARIMHKIMDVSGAESLAAAANVFIGQTEAPLAIKPYLATMTRSEIMAMMTGGMATVSGGVMAAYAGMGADPGHLLAASIMSAPASLVIAKVMVPETEESPTKGFVKLKVKPKGENILDAACHGAAEGLKLALNVAAMLIAFIALVALVNWCFGIFPTVGGKPLTLERILGWLFSPIAWLLGIPWKESQIVGSLIGQKTILNEFIAYKELIKLKNELSYRSFTIATYALCGFANFSSVAIQIGGIGSLEPSRRKDFAKLGFRAMIAGTIAALMTASIAGILL